MINSSLVSVTKQVIRAAAKYGIEEAGTRIMGSAWAPFKAMLSPVFVELEKRYPKFLLLDVPSVKNLHKKLIWQLKTQWLH